MKIAIDPGHGMSNRQSGIYDPGATHKDNGFTKPFAQSLQSALLSVTKFKDRKIKKRDDLAVLKFKGPVALIELGFIAHDANRETLLNPQVRGTICTTIAQVTLESFAE